MSKHTQNKQFISSFRYSYNSKSSKLFKVNKVLLFKKTSFFFRRKMSCLPILPGTVTTYVIEKLTKTQYELKYKILTRQRLNTGYTARKIPSTAVFNIKFHQMGPSNFKKLQNLPQVNPQVNFYPKNTSSSKLYTDLLRFMLYRYTTSKYFFHSKKASVITTTIDFLSSLSTYPTYLTASQNVNLKNLYKLNLELKYYTNALFVKQDPHINFFSKISMSEPSLLVPRKVNQILIGSLPDTVLQILTSRLLKLSFRTSRHLHKVGRKYTKTETVKFLKHSHKQNMLFTNRGLLKLNRQRNQAWYYRLRFTRKIKSFHKNFFARLKWAKSLKFNKTSTTLTQFNNVNRSRGTTGTNPILNCKPAANFYMLKFIRKTTLRNFNSLYLLNLFLFNPFFIKILNISIGTSNRNLLTQLNHDLGLSYANKSKANLNYSHSNLLPTVNFNTILTKQLSSLFSLNKTREDVIPLFYHTLVRFVEHVSGKKFLFQFYPFLNQNITTPFIIRYKSWIPRMGSYERRLGHKFFFEEALHIMHLSFILRDSVLFSNWLKAMILRISFWKTRSIFRFIRYLYLLYFTPTFSELGVKGLKIKLKGKISVAGNSRKRTILYRTGQTSHSEVNLKVSHSKQTINTFTGVMGFQIWIFY